MNQKKQLVVKFEPGGAITDIGAEAAKAMPPSNRYRYSQLNRITLEDGSSHFTTAKAMTKPKLAAAVASDQRHVDLKRWFVVLTDDGTHISHSQIEFRI